MPYWLKGLLIGLAVAAPVGPIGILCIRRSLAEGWRAGFVSGLGAATADALYGCIAAFGLTAVAQLLMQAAVGLKWVGGAFLCYLGYQTFRSRPSETAVETKKSTLAAAYATTLSLTATNPATIISFAAIFAGLGMGSGGGTGVGSALEMVLGVFAGSALWWMFLSSAVSLLRSRLDGHALVWVNRLSGTILLGFGMWALFSAIR
ncbi:LysE family transporter [Heliobacterium undosum]|uniref:LysE family transporter n=1 Tax=Heliomicrobium undosum TaxID=121734 RepID=A0A845LBP6_9FIRM|nr:LysE family translocator [Heliomicrobium undosum]MZP31098.1 LysE family transporter [Heliomicrobium undosum]